MGIQGLTSFVNREFKNWQNEEVSGKLVIDGYSLMFCLYETCDWTHGGQYSEFREKLRHFFHQLEHSEVEAVVVMDGVDVEGKKEPVIIRRKRDAVRTIDRYCGRERRSFASGSGVIPPHTVRVFIMLLQEMEVDLLFADGEGDETVFKIASAYGCPVLSNDSDFFMFNVTGGYIPISRFHWEHSVPIRADVYYHKHFCEAFGMADLKLRLAIPAIAGNDLIPAVSDARFTEHVLKTITSFENRVNIKAVVNFVRTFPSFGVFKESMKKLPNVDSHARRKLEANCRQSEELYDSNQVVTLDHLKASTTLRLYDSTEMPSWVLKQYRCGDFLCVYALICGSSILYNYIEDCRKSSCTLASKPIRKFTYGLTGRQEVREFFREGLDLCEERVKVATSLNGSPLPSLVQISTLPRAERARLFYSMLGCKDAESAFSRLEEKWRLVIATTRFWFNACSPCSLEVEMLILCFVVLHTSTVKPQRLEEILEHFRKTEEWMDVLHAFSQWQSCYSDALNLNQMLLLPLPSVSPADLYNGTLLMFLVGYGGTEQLRSYLLKKPEMKLYEELIDAVVGGGTAVGVRRRPVTGDCRNRGDYGRSSHQHSARYGAVELSRYFCDEPIYCRDGRSGGDGRGRGSAGWRRGGGDDRGRGSAGWRRGGGDDRGRGSAGWRRGGDEDRGRGSAGWRHYNRQDYGREQQQGCGHPSGWTDHCQHDGRHGDRRSASNYGGSEQYRSELDRGSRGYSTHHNYSRGHDRGGYHSDRRYFRDSSHGDREEHRVGYRGSGHKGFSFHSDRGRGYGGGGYRRRDPYHDHSSAHNPQSRYGSAENRSSDNSDRRA